MGVGTLPRFPPARLAAGPGRRSECEVRGQSPNFLVGDVAQLRARLRANAELGMNDFIVWMNRGGAIPQREVLASMELFAKEVIPEFRGVNLERVRPGHRRS